MLEKLLKYINSPKLPGDPFVRLDSIRFENEDGILCVSVMDYYGQEKWSNWTIKAKKLRDYNIINPYGDLVQLKADHVLIRQHMETWQKLYFRGIPQSEIEIVGQLLVAHRETVGDWIPFAKFFNSCCKLNGLLTGGFGQLADGPTFLIEKYASVLLSAGLKPNALTPRCAKWWNGDQWINNTVSLSAFVIGDSFFVAEEFEEQQNTTLIN